YLGSQATWFFAFGLQTTLFPYVALVVLGVGEARFGAAQTSLLAPALVLLLFGGVIAERLDRRLLLALLHFAAAIPPASLAFAAVHGQLSFAALVAYGVAIGIIGAIMMPTRDAALNAVAGAQGDLSVQRAVVFASLVQFLGQMAGMTLAALTPSIGLGEPIAVLMAIQAGVIALGGVSALFMPRLTPPRAQAPRPGVFRELAEGVRVVWRSPVIRSMSLVMFAVGVFVVGGGFFVLLPLFVSVTQGGGLKELGFMFVTFWAGAALATVALARFGHVRRPGRMIGAVLIVGAASLAALQVEMPFLMLAGLVAVWGASAGVGIAMSRTIVQDAAPKDALARVLSIYQLGFMGGAPIGAIVTGVIAQASGVRATSLGLMAGLLVSAAWILLATPLGRVEGRAAPARH
ncbi:MAG: MFS transporter, partial [Caulobacterales bacterium]|nr:MFS transporter [Caulobacterales bacterium]